jgi:threonine dehydrogenase-like Zn-dependent dehydrogenase
MKALVYFGPAMRVVEMPDAKIEQPTDVLVKITTTNICDPTFTCEGRTDMEAGKI